ncbi:MAG TPA: hypothetical protein PKL23_00935 [Candidatus Egerieousia sp.]|nr:hypothetical protein [Candidatus Egerieousia sp.]
MLNESYYKKLLNKYSISDDCNRLVQLSTAIVLDNYRNRNICFKFPVNYDIVNIVNTLYESLSKYIFQNHSDFPPSTCEKFKKIGGSRQDVFKVENFQNGKVYLKNIVDPSYHITMCYDGFLKNYIPIQQNVKKGALVNVQKYFSNVNQYDFLPTYFSKKIVFVAGQTMWNKLDNKRNIPSIYLPSTRDDEQNLIRSIPALEDCISYITSRYNICYEELLKKGILIDAIVLCDADLSSITQIIQDQQQYKFKFIILSSENEIQELNNLAIWNWQKEEVEVMEKMTGSAIEIIKVDDDYFSKLFEKFEKSTIYVSTLEPPIKLNNYSYYARLALNAIQEDSFDYALYRLRIDKELERNEGGYDMDYLGENNPKLALKALIEYLKSVKYKICKIKELWNDFNRRLFIIADREDVDFLKKQLKTTKNILTYTELRKQIKSGTIQNKTLFFYSFDGTKKEFDFINSLPNSIKLLLYQQEFELYINQLQNHNANIENELMSEDRFLLSNVKYEPIIETLIKISPTLEEIICKLDERSQKAYDGYKEECESLLDDSDEQITYQITLSNGNIVELESSETVFNSKGSLIKSYRLKTGDKVRIYPREQLAENLLQIAVEVEPDKFGDIHKHSQYWQEILKVCDNLFPDRETLYGKLKSYGLKVLPATVDAYFNGKRKFPMFNSDLHAVCSLADEVMPDGNFVQEMLPLIKKSKRLYNSTMIALGRGIKQELKQFLQEETLGDILQKKNFTIETLNKFLKEQMPLLTIMKIEEVCNE